MRYLNIDNVKTVNLFIESESYTVLKVSYFKNESVCKYISLHSKIIQRLWRRKIFKIKKMTSHTFMHKDGRNDKFIGGN